VCAIRLESKKRGRFSHGGDVILLDGGEFSSEGAFFSPQTSLLGRFYFTKGRHFKGAMLFDRHTSQSDRSTLFGSVAAD